METVEATPAASCEEILAQASSIVTQIRELTIQIDGLQVSMVAAGSKLGMTMKALNEDLVLERRHLSNLMSIAQVTQRTAMLSIEKNVRRTLHDTLLPSVLAITSSAVIGGCLGSGLTAFILH
ncbi:hypothetical protein ACU5P1_05800 [Pseudomonas plecoglossicida]|uniref:Uncharacterized protein n=1 Tax=Pseudomonas plecoglossicida TaxID=70775 RepID=A0AAD0VVB5_PSEDL|nr:hypothetical protein [Pseudomonas plecoglossicida]AXM98217.1 hypothetical protein DVB73_21725 [Pseudomonas plecoglossicida]EPB97610.1 hypothetical protein L321_02061 [Pseudomonas plecoglossicida NB2011]QLB54361.1 hypothetical protein HAV28_05750 [Pseudomonas plecoglossicida]GLR37672.1 hypothetical protein GCM10011247_30700 [Pseudomonas plecoglossicida]